MLRDDKASSFEELFEQDRSVSIHTRDFQVLTEEMFKVYHTEFDLILIFHISIGCMLITLLCVSEVIPIGNTLY